MSSCNSSYATYLSPGNSITASYSIPSHTSGTSDSHDATSSMAPRNIQDLRIMQWNVRGIISNSGAFHHQCNSYTPDVCMLQELNTKYKENFYVKNFKTWAYLGDKYAKTGIYIKHYLPHGYIPIKLQENNIKDIRNIIYCTGLDKN